MSVDRQFLASDLGFDGAAPSQQFRRHGRDAFARSADQDAGTRHAMAAKSSVDHGQ